MATAIAHHIPPQHIPASFYVALTLTEQEAVFLRDVMNSIGGCDVKSRRVYAGRVDDALRMVGVGRGERDGNSELIADISRDPHCGALYFRQQKEDIK